LFTQSVFIKKNKPTKNKNNQKRKVSFRIFVRQQLFMKLLLITLVLLGLGVAGIAIKIWAKKDGEFAGTCASQNPILNKDGEACGFCGKTPEQYKDCSEPGHK
tara:strand:- start:65 stop:373 length:309 start_codon:yes stop_codon:yes gene_type:complete